MEWVEAAKRLPKEVGSYHCVDKRCNSKKVLWFNCKNTRSLFHRYKHSILWLDENTQNKNFGNWQQMIN